MATLTHLSWGRLFMPSALHGVRVLDVSTTVAGAWCTRLLAGLGADVVMLEPPAGHPTRALDPKDARGVSILSTYVLAGKRSLTLNLDTAEGQESARQIAARMDVVVSSARPSELAARRLRYPDLRAPALVMAHVTAHGMTGPLAETQGNDLTAAARSGWASINGYSTRSPLKPAAWGASLCTGIAAASAIAAALFHRDRHPGEGQEVDVAEIEVLAGMFAPPLLGTEYSGVPVRRRDPSDLLGGPVPVRDGHFALTLSRAHFWRDAMNLLGLTDLADDPRWGAMHYRQEHRDEYVTRVAEAMGQWDKAELFEELAIRRVVAGPVLTMAELAQNEHLRARGFWVSSDGGEDVDVPGAPFRLSATPFDMGGHATSPGADSAAILAEVETER